MLLLAAALLQSLLCFVWCLFCFCCADGRNTFVLFVLEAVACIYMMVDVDYDDRIDELEDPHCRISRQTTLAASIQYTTLSSMFVVEH